MFQPCNDLPNNFNRNLRKKTEGNQVLTIQNKKHKEVQEETNEDKLPQFTTAGMRPLIDESRLLERVKHATIREDIPNQNHTRRATTNIVQ